MAGHGPIHSVHARTSQSLALTACTRARPRHSTTLLPGTRPSFGTRAAALARHPLAPPNHRHPPTHAPPMCTASPRAPRRSAARTKPHNQPVASKDLDRQAIIKGQHEKHKAFLKVDPRAHAPRPRAAPTPRAHVPRPRLAPTSRAHAPRPRPAPTPRTHTPRAHAPRPRFAPAATHAPLLARAHTSCPPLAHPTPAPHPSPVRAARARTVHRAVQDAHNRRRHQDVQAARAHGTRAHGTRHARTRHRHARTAHAHGIPTRTARAHWRTRTTAQAHSTPTHMAAPHTHTADAHALVRSAFDALPHAKSLAEQMTDLVEFLQDTDAARPPLSRTRASASRPRPRPRASASRPGEASAPRPQAALPRPPPPLSPQPRPAPTTPRPGPRVKSFQSGTRWTSARYLSY